jgi:Tol biopolymer transport system component
LVRLTLEPEMNVNRLFVPLVAVALGAAPFALPKPKITLLFTDRGHTAMGEMAVTRDGQRIYHLHDSTDVFVYDRATRRDTHVIGGVPGRCAIAVSTAADRLAFCRAGDDGVGAYLWTIALDPATGFANGNARRVSISRATDPAFSPDGKFIAFGARPLPQKSSENLVVVPVNGGPERTLVNTGGDIWPTRWLAGGIYYGLSFDEPKDAGKNGVYRIDPNGGAASMLRRTADWGGYPGISPDARSLVTWDSTWDSVVVSSPAGKRISSYVPEEGEPSADVMTSATRGLGWKVSMPRSVQITSLADGSTRPLIDSAFTYGDPQWSPDGRTLLVSYNRARIVLANADGSGRPRVIWLRRPTTGQYGIEWSPDGRSIFYRESIDSGSIHVIDVQSGADRIVAGHSDQAAAPRWRNDSRGILYTLMSRAQTPDSVRDIMIREAMIGGGDRTLQTIRVRCVHPPFCAKFASDSVLVTWTNTGRPDSPIPYSTTNFRAHGAPAPVFTRDAAGLPNPAFSPDGEWMAVRRRASDGSRQSVEVMKVDGSARQSVSLPFGIAPGVYNPLLFNGGTEMIVVGVTDSIHSIYRVNIPTAKVTKLATLPAKTPVSDIRVSRDGKSVAYTVAHTPFVNYYEFDFSQMLRAGGPK